MTYQYRLIAFLLFFAIAAKAQSDEMQIDSNLAKKITISGFCLCKTKLDSLQSIAKFIKVDVEEMDLCKNSHDLSDARFQAWEGYYSESYPGMIFQKDVHNRIAKVRLSKEYHGALPDGTMIDMKTFKLKDLLKLYPKLDST